MSQFILGADLKGKPPFLGADEQKARLAKLPPAYVVALSVVVLFGIAAAVWWAWLVSQGLTVAYTEGFRGIRLPEE